MDTRENTTKVEILAPAGSFETLQAVIEAGADAVYIGGTRFGARAYADNPAEDELLQAIDYAHLRGVKVYMTVNTLLTDSEMAELYDYLNPYYKAGLDACIVQDLGVLSFLRSHFPKMPIHISTQMTVTDAEAAELFDDGVTRIVPARELSLAEIRAMRKKTGRELEIFVHGALCYCYSGQCLLSSLIGGRSGNRGKCAQPCRKQYRYTEGNYQAEGYLLSPKDQCLLPRLHELLETGIHSLKIEGRMKRLTYAAGVTAIYRKWIDRFYELGSDGYRRYLDKHAREMEEDVRTLAELFNRGGFCEGYVFDCKGPDMMCIKRPNHSGVQVGTARITKNGTRLSAIPSFTAEIGPGEVLELRTEDEQVTCGEWTTPRDMSGYKIPAIPILWKKEYGALPESRCLNIWRMKKEPLLDALTEQYGKQRKPLPINGIFTAAPEEPMTFTVQSPDGETCVSVSGPVPEKAIRAGADENSVREKLTKTGGTAFCFAELSVFLADGLFLPVSVLNQMRRQALDCYEAEYLKRFRREDGTEDKPLGSNLPNTSDTMAHRVIASVMTKEQFEIVQRDETVTDIYLDMEGDCAECVPADYGKPTYLMLPRVLKGIMRERVLSDAERLYASGRFCGMVVRSVDQLAWARKKSIRMESDKSLYSMNATAVEYLKDKGISTVTLSEELRKEALPKTSQSVLTVYGRSVAMVSEQCPRRTLGLCKRKTGGQDGTSGTAGFDGMLTDGEGAHFPTKSICKFCHGMMYNSQVMSLIPYMREIPTDTLSGIRLDFTLEDAGETETVLRDLRKALFGEEVAGYKTTAGHWNRGVE